MLTWIRNTPISVKTAIAPVLAILCLLIVAMVGLFANQNLGQSVSTLGQVRVKRIIEVNNLDRKLQAIHIMVNQTVAWEGSGFKPEPIAELDRAILAAVNDYEAALLEESRLPMLTAEDKQAAQAIAAEFANYKKSVKDVLDIKSVMLANAAAFMTKMEASFAILRKGLDAQVLRQRQLSAQAMDSAQSVENHNRMAILFGSAAAVLLTAVLSFLVARTIVRPLEEAASLAGAVASGDLRQLPQSISKDTTGQVLSALGDVSVNLGQIVTRIRSTADEIRLASNEIAAGNVNLSQRTESNASSLQQTSATIEQLAATIKQSADSAVQADDFAREATQVATQGGAAASDLIETMKDLSQQATKIKDITGVIDSIAFQTNILALNAAVEAARAGEHGRGFGVVASEVRTLAKRCADSAKEIRALISTSVDAVHAGVQKVEMAGAMTERTLSAVQRVAGTVDSISHMLSEQATGIAQVNQAVSDMDRSTQQNAALVEEAASATVSLSQQAQALVEAIAVFRIGDQEAHQPA